MSDTFEELAREAAIANKNAGFEVDRFLIAARWGRADLAKQILALAAHHDWPDYVKADIERLVKE